MEHDARAHLGAELAVGGALERRSRPGLFQVDSWLYVWVALGIGLMALPLTLLLIHASAQISAAAISGLLGPGRRDLTERVERLEETRAGAVDAARLELERIERDLHDGAQARIGAIAMELGRAEQKLAAGDSEGATELVGEARDDTQRALAELRERRRRRRSGRRRPDRAAQARRGARRDAAHLQPVRRAHDPAR